jgi:hypothetical protein
MGHRILIKGVEWEGLATDVLIEGAYIEQAD